MAAAKHRFFKLILLLALSLNASFIIQAQTGEGIGAGKKPETLANYSFDSKLMARRMSYRVIFPENYDALKAQTERYPVIYLLHGLSGHYDNWADKTKIVEYSKNYDFLIVMPEGGDGWYTDSVSESSDRYESYIIQELIPEMDKKFRTVADRKNRFVAGLSMGGYGSIKFGLKHPELFSLVGSFSGALEAASWTDKNTAEWLSKSIMKVYGAADSKTRAENDIYKITRDLPPEKIKDLPFIYASCGTEDIFLKNSLDFANLLREKKIPHEFRELPGKHGWDFWDSQVQEFLRLSERFLK